MHKSEYWNYDEGRWIGPPDLRFFLRENWWYCAYWFVGDMLIVGGICANVAGWGWLGVPVGIAAGASVWFLMMFAFSRGWMAEGD
jgi:hypothetical protein